MSQLHDALLLFCDTVSSPLGRFADTVDDRDSSTCSPITTCPPSTDTSLPTDLPTLTTSHTSSNALPCLTYTTITNCIAPGQNTACATTTTCGVYSTLPPVTTTTSTPAPTSTKHCVDFSFGAASGFDTEWSASVIDNGNQECKIGPVAIKKDNPNFDCGKGYRVRVDSSNARLEYIKTWYTAPGSGGEVYYEVPLRSDVTQGCGTLSAPLQCRTTQWAGCVFPTMD